MLTAHIRSGDVEEYDGIPVGGGSPLPVFLENGVPARLQQEKDSDTHCLLIVVIIGLGTGILKDEYVISS